MQAWGKVWTQRRPNVLVVDDDDSIREVLAEVLREEGYDVSCAGNGEQALTELREHGNPDLMLLDLMMPVMSGWELLELLQSRADLSRHPRRGRLGDERARGLRASRQAD